MKNTVMTYKYTDRFGYSTANSIVFSGQIDATGKNKLISFLKDGYFIPSAVGLPNLQGDIQQYDIIRVCNNIFVIMNPMAMRDLIMCGIA
jgi:hypothetical protein